ncbi:response regulator [Cloacibacillus sp. An23]|uniref:response regulator n=1 Tax=Cloacibacillus sp. An23 TaxID=1965591 RepID=UPI000B37E5F6|nr:response regulator [Cloacibacillus sp. An23]OUO94641.1 two-component system response regulator [Cloacibacillus sp. An23]
MKARVLIADDSVHMRMILKEMLVRCGCEVVGEAEDGAEAVRMYDELMPDVATLDISMPKMDGIAALKAIKAKHPNARLVTVGAMNQQKLVIEAVRAGTSGFFLKPFQSERVAEAIERALK